MAWRYRIRADEIGVCRECGEDCSLLRRPGLIERVRYFLTMGAPAPEVWLCGNGHETDGQRSAVRALRNSRFGGLPRLSRAIKAIHDGRSMEPVPLTYLVAGAAGVVVGIALDLTLGWAWWLVALVVVAGVWLFFMGSAFRGNARRRLMSNLQMIVNPERARIKELDRLVGAVADGSVAAYGLADWPGSVAIGGWGGSDDEIRTISLDHYVEDERRAGRITVEFQQTPPRAREFVIEQLREDFVVNSPELPPQRASGDLGQRMTQRRWQALQKPLPDWEEATIDVDGAATVFQVLQRSGAVVAVTDLGAGGMIVLLGERIGLVDVALTRLGDISRYVEGMRTQLERQQT